MTRDILHWQSGISPSFLIPTFQQIATLVSQGRYVAGRKVEKGCTSSWFFFLKSSLLEKICRSTIEFLEETGKDSLPSDYHEDLYPASQ